ncbi:MAG: M20 family metallopeptidase [Bacillota bacterium]|nr:M20 family metallopeptidase [Bacillota bacterium]
MENLLEEAKKLQSTIVMHRRYLHENAEINVNLPLTTKYVIDRLKEMGYDPKEICQSEVVAIVGGKKPGKTFMLRADMDALPIVEETDVSFKSRNNSMHACGHDMHTSMLLGAAELLKKHEDEIEGQIKLMFQPGEETLAGAKNMIEAGVLENPKVDAAMMIHVITGMPIPSGTVLVLPSGAASAASDRFTVKVHGKGGHGAMPHTTVDPLNVISHIHLALQSINSREVAPADNVALTVCQIHGGNAANVIPDTAFLSGTIRTYCKESREFIKNRIHEISMGIASTLRASAAVEHNTGCPSVINDKSLVEQFVKYSNSLLAPYRVVNMDEKTSASEDFGFVSELVPSLMVILSAGSPQDGYSYPQHHPKALFDENNIYIGAALYTNMAMEWLKNN